MCLAIQQQQFFLTFCFQFNQSKLLCFFFLIFILAHSEVTTEVIHNAPVIDFDVSLLNRVVPIVCSDVDLVDFETPNVYDSEILLDGDHKGFFFVFFYFRTMRRNGSVCFNFLFFFVFERRCERQ